MGGLRVFALFAIIPVTMLLALSFFILVVARKQELKGLRIFGVVLAVLLWISAGLVFSSAVYSAITGKHPMSCGMKGQMKSPRQMRRPMMREQMPGDMHDLLPDPMPETR